MDRQTRTELSSAIHHVLIRDNRRELTWTDEGERKRVFETCGE